MITLLSPAPEANSARGHFRGRPRPQCQPLPASQPPRGGRMKDDSARRRFPRPFPVMSLISNMKSPRGQGERETRALEGRAAPARPASPISLSLSRFRALAPFQQACARPKPVRNPESYDGAEREFRRGTNHHIYILTEPISGRESAAIMIIITAKNDENAPPFSLSLSDLGKKHTKGVWR